MVNDALINPRHIVVVGASNDVHKPGGKILKNLLDHRFAGELRVLHPREAEVQGVRAFRDLADLPETDLAILAVPAAACP
jgi:acetyltransferase